MESPVVLDKPPEYHGNHERGFPFDEEEGSGAWSELAARHPDIAARLRQRPATWARKRRPSSQDASDDFGDSFGGFDRFPFDDIPPEFRDHFPSHWNRRFGSRDEPQPTPQASSPPTQPPQQHTTATQTEQPPGPSEQEEQTHLPQYGLRNTVDLGQKSPADPSLVDADERNQRSMSAPPDSNNQQSNMSSHQESFTSHPSHNEQGSNVRHIPIFVEGRDEPVINKSVDHGPHFGGETKQQQQQQYSSPPHIDRDGYFADDTPAGFHHPPNFTRAFGTPFNKGFRQCPQPFVQQKAYPQSAFNRGPSPQRSQSPKQQEEPFVKVPVHHEHATKAEPPQSRAQKQPPAPSPQPPHSPAPSPQPPREQTPPQAKPQPSPNDPITLILSIQTDVLNLMTDVENFTGSKKDKRYLFLDEMLTRNLIKLDNIETDGKENIRQARKEAIKCIQKCIAVLEAKAEKGNAQEQNKDVDMQNQENGTETTEQVTANGEVEMNETKEPATQVEQPQVPVDAKPEEAKAEVTAENKEATQPQAADTRPEDKPEQTEANVEEQKENVDNKSSPKKAAKTVKKRDKSKDNKDKIDVPKDVNVETAENEKMQVDDKAEKDPQVIMEVDGAASQ